MRASLRHCLLLALAFLPLALALTEGPALLINQRLKGPTRPLAAPFPGSPACNRPPAVPGDRRNDTSTLSLLVYNSEWLFFKGSKSTLVQCPGKGCPWKNALDVQAHFEHVAAVIRKADADVVHLTEVESCDALEKLVGLLPGMAYRFYLVPGKDVATGQNVGLLTRVDPVRVLDRSEEKLPFPLPDSRCSTAGGGPHLVNAATKSGMEGDKLAAVVLAEDAVDAENVDVQTEGLYGVTKQYVTRIVVNGVSIWLAGSHFLAMPTDALRCPKREVQAQVMKNYLQKLSTFEGEEAIIMGDFNDYDHDVEDAAGKVDEPISATLSILKSTTSPPLVNLASMWPDVSERYSNWYDRNHNCQDDGGNEHVLIDHVLVSKGLAARVIETRPLHDYEEFCGTMDSDHWPIYVKFRMDPFSP